MDTGIDYSRQPEFVRTNQPMSYGYDDAQHVQQPVIPLMPMVLPTYTSNTTTVVINQQPQQQQHRGPRNWSTGLCGCLEDASSCMLTWCCTPCYSCYLSVDLGESCCLPMCFCPGECCPPVGTSVPWLVALRVKIREAHNIQGNIMGDCMTVCCCPYCVMCQLKREYDFIRKQPHVN